MAPENVKMVREGELGLHRERLIVSEILWLFFVNGGDSWADNVMESLA